MNGAKAAAATCEIPVSVAMSSIGVSSGVATNSGPVSCWMASRTAASTANSLAIDTSRVTLAP